ncbi:MAG: thioredoxin family protein [Bacteroidales bacterium]|nr:thioredoxin family protein [Bacteroidales bacterium]
MKKVLFIIITVICSAQVAPAQIKWMGIEEAMRKQDSMPKTVIIDMYTDWCGWCKKMDAETFHDPSIAMYINNNFYPVKFNAETTDTIMFPIKHTDEKTGEKTTELKPFINLQSGQRSPHMLAQMLMSGRMSYPTLVFIDFEGGITPVPGYMSPEDLEPMLVYFAERINKYSPWNEYMECFNAALRPDLDTTMRFNSNIDWMDFNKAVEKMKTQPKKLLLYIYSDWNSSSKIMMGGSFKENILAEYINKNFYAVKIPYDITDTLRIAGHEFVNETGQMQYPNQLVVSLLHPDYRIPAFIIFDEHATHPLFVQRGFSSHITIEKILTYFNDNLQDKGVDIQKYYNEYQSKLRENKNKQN